MTTDPIDTEELREDVSYAHRLTGTYQADSSRDYYPAMRRIFEAVPALLDENAALRARIKAVEDVLEESEARGPVGMTFNGTPFPAWISIATIRRALTA